MLSTHRFLMFFSLLLLSTASVGESVRIRMLESTPAMRDADGQPLPCTEGSEFPVGGVLQTKGEGRVCLEWRWEGVKPGQTDVMLLGFNTTVKRLADEGKKRVFELQQGMVRLTQRNPGRDSEDVLMFQGSPLECKAADAIVESKPLEAEGSSLSGGKIMSNGNRGRVVWMFGKRRVGFSGPGMREIRPEGRVGGVIPLTNAAWTDAVGQTNVIGFNMSEADKSVEFDNKGDGPSDPATPKAPAAVEPVLPALVRFETNLGPFVVKIDTENYPITCRNFLAYVDADFYDGTLFHRVISDFMVQGGGFDTDMRQKKTRSAIKNEAGLGPIKNTRGTIAMARTSAIDSATSQFYINHKDNAFLDDGPYCAFGRVVEGMSTIDAIAKQRTVIRRGMRDVPEEQIIIQSAQRVETSP